MRRRAVEGELEGGGERGKVVVKWERWCVSLVVLLVVSVESLSGGSPWRVSLERSHGGFPGGLLGSLLRGSPWRSAWVSVGHRLLGSLGFRVRGCVTGVCVCAGQEEVVNVEEGCRSRSAHDEGHHCARPPVCEVPTLVLCVHQGEIPGQSGAPRLGVHFRRHLSRVPAAKRECH